MLRNLVIAATMVIASPSVAQECRPSEAVLPTLERLNATHAIYEGEAVRRAVKIYAAMPPVGPEPVADHIILAELPTGSVVLLFIRDAMICATMTIPDTRAAAMAKAFIIGVEV
jgi:hypothetical protein